MEKQVQDLIGQGRLEDALQVLTQNNVDGALNLLSRFNVAKRENSLGLMDFSDWSRVQAQITNSALELLKMNRGSVSSTAASTAPFSPTPSTTTAQTAAQTTVFISYAYKPLDLDYAKVVAEYLQQNGLTPRIDLEELLPGDNIKDFIVNQIRENNVILSLVSENSLRSGWVGLESNLALFAQLLTEKGFVPVAIDKSYSEPDFFFSAIDGLDAEIKELDENIDKAKKRGLGYKNFETRRERLFEHRNQLPKILDHFQNVRTPDISEDFEGGMQQVVRAIKRLRPS